MYTVRDAESGCVRMMSTEEIFQGAAEVEKLLHKGIYLRGRGWVSQTCQGRLEQGEARPRHLRRSEEDVAAFQGCERPERVRA